MRLGADIALLDSAALAARFPYLSVDDVAIASLGLSGEGWFDGYGLMQAFRKAARARGVEYRQTRVTGLTRNGARIEAVQLETGETLACGTFINAAGASGARGLCEMAGFPVPVYAKKRSVFSFAAKGEFPAHPLIIDTSGVGGARKEPASSPGSLRTSRSRSILPMISKWIGRFSKRRSGQRWPRASRPSKPFAPAVPGRAIMT